VQGREVQAQSLPASQLCGEAAGIVSQDQWGAIRSLKERRVGNRAIARLLGISVTTVRRRARSQPSHWRSSSVRAVVFLRLLTSEIC
jgi:hypothetical protein